MKTGVPELSEAELRLLDEAEGWLGLDLWREALETISHIGEQNQRHPDVLCCQSRAYAVGREWEMAAVSSYHLSRVVPLNLSAWLRMSFALFSLGRRAQAKRLLVSVVPRFPREPDLRWHLAVYAIAEDNLGEAKAWIRKAVALTSGPRLRALPRERPQYYALWKQVQREDRAVHGKR